MQKLILSADAKVTWDKGKTTINVPTSNEPYVSNEPAILLLLNAFLQNPITPAIALEQLKGKITADLLKTL